MSKSKSVFVTALFAVMLAAIDAGMYKMFPLGFFVLTGVLALFGFWQLSKGFLGWLLHNEEPLALPEIHAEPVGLDEGFTPNLEEIMKEVRDEAGA